MKVAILGCGMQGLRHLAAFAHEPRVSEVLTADLDPHRARAAAGRSGATWISLDGIFQDDDVDAVVIAAPTQAHLPLVRRALDSGKHVLCEKPFGASAAEASAMAEQADAARLVGHVGYLYRVAPAIAAARRAIADLGTIRGARLIIAGPGNRAAWKHRRESGGGAINELASHMVDLALWCFGPVEDCAVFERIQFRQQRVIADEVVTVDAEDRIVARLVSATGVSIMLEADFAAAYFAQSLDIDGVGGTVRATIEGSPDLYQRQAASFLDAIAGDAGDACDFDEAAQVCAVLERLHRTPAAEAVA